MKMLLRTTSLHFGTHKFYNNTTKSFGTRQFFTKTLQKDQILRTFNSDFTVSIIENTIAVQQAKENHKITCQDATEVLGKFLTASSLLASSLKGEERLIIDAAFQDYSRIYAEAVQVGEVRGFIKDRSTPGTPIDTHFTISKILYNFATPIDSIVPTQKEDVISELQSYFDLSEQRPAIVHLETKVTDSVLFSGGLLMEVMPASDQIDPDRDAKIIANFRARLEKSIPLSVALQTRTLRDLLHDLVPNADSQNVKRVPLHFFCRCTKNQFMHAVSQLGKATIEDMQSKGHRTLHCQYCGKDYDLSAEDFEKMKQQI